MQKCKFLMWSLGHFQRTCLNTRPITSMEEGLINPSIRSWAHGPLVRLRTKRSICHVPRLRDVAHDHTWSCELVRFKPKSAHGKEKKSCTGCTQLNFSLTWHGLGLESWSRWDTVPASLASARNTRDYKRLIVRRVRLLRSIRTWCWGGSRG